MSEFNYICFNCHCESPSGLSQLDADIKAYEDGWHIGHFNGQGEIVCADCIQTIFDAIPMVPLQK